MRGPEIKLDARYKWEAWQQAEVHPAICIGRFRPILAPLGMHSRTAALRCPGAKPARLFHPPLKAKHGLSRREGSGCLPSHARQAREPGPGLAGFDTSAAGRYNHRTDQKEQQTCSRAMIRHKRLRRARLSDSIELSPLIS